MCVCERERERERELLQILGLVDKKRSKKQETHGSEGYKEHLTHTLSHTHTQSHLDV